MKAKELKIDNYVIHNDEIKKVVGVLQDDSGGFEIWMVDKNKKYWNSYNVSPIPLTEEWLVKFGFEKSGTTYTLNLNKVSRIYYYKKSDGFVELGANGYHFMNVKLEYVHQLQNLYFALTNKELTLK